MTEMTGEKPATAPGAAEAGKVVLVPPETLAERTADALREAGADEPSTEATTRALMHASLLGVDSHGVRLAVHYAKVLGTGRVNGRPTLSVTRTAPATAMIDADNALGPVGAYRAIEVGREIVAETGIAAVGVMRSSHYGAAGAYALAGAEQGYFTFSTTNADGLVALFEGKDAFHGTNPLAFGAPTASGRPWLFDMATSSIPLNRVYLYRNLDKPLPENVAADASGTPVTDPHLADMLLPLGAAFGFKGAGLAGVATILAAAFTGGGVDNELLSMTRGEDWSTPRNLGHFFFLIDPERFAGRAAYEAAMTSYLTALRAVPPVEGGRVMAPGDREWAVAERRRAEGIPVDLETARFLGVS